MRLQSCCGSYPTIYFSPSQVLIFSAFHLILGSASVVLSKRRMHSLEPLKRSPDYILAGVWGVPQLFLSPHNWGIQGVQIPSIRVSLADLRFSNNTEILFCFYFIAIYN
jgi:hypothetical protein